jgi:undecaprenyl diphosphate synthase
MSSKSLINLDKLPSHVAIIMDGNGRWAKEQGQDRVVGHQNGVKSVRDTVEAAGELGIQYLTLYAFSTENWNRPQYEIDALMSLLVSALRNETEKLKASNVQLRVIGDTKALPTSCQNELQEAIDILQPCTGLVLILALSYGAKWELQQMIKQIAIEYKEGKISLDDIKDNLITSHLTTAHIPDPALLIRTGGEQRISNFLLYQLAYSELYFCNTHWPDFDKEAFYTAIVDYQQRERRFGKTSQQITGEQTL